MARNYETICGHLCQAGEQKLLKISNSFQEHQAWLKQAFEEARAQLSSQKQPAVAKPGRARDAAEKVSQPQHKGSVLLCLAYSVAQHSLACTASFTLTI